MGTKSTQPNKNGNELRKCSKKIRIANLNIFDEFANGYILVVMWWKIDITRRNIFVAINIKFVSEMLDINNKIHEIDLLNHCFIPCLFIDALHRWLQIKADFFFHRYNDVWFLWCCTPVIHISRWKKNSPEKAIWSKFIRISSHRIFAVSWQR